jgi:hypothetical protein
MSEQEPSALRECPYCGERAIMTTLHTNNGRADNPLAYAYVVRCFVCEAQRLPAATPQIAVKEWNRRDGEAARVAEAVAAERVRIDALVRDGMAQYQEPNQTGKIVWMVQIIDVLNAIKGSAP